MNKLHFCGDFDNEVTLEEKKLIPHLKRFFECLNGDPDFAQAIKNKDENCENLLKDRGIYGVDLSQIWSFLSEQEKGAQNLLEVPIELFDDKPQIKLWIKWANATKTFREEYIRSEFATPSIRYDKWRDRQIKRCSSQMPKMSSEALIHASVAIELSDGCSRQCSFCGLASDSLKGVFRYTEDNKRLWNDVLGVLMKRLGNSVGKGVCYWGTEPSDNPDYFKFLSDFGKVTGNYPQTTTAAPTLNLDWIKELLSFRYSHPTSADRFSILSLKEMREIHKIFTAEELSYVEFIMQYTDMKKNGMANAGRNRDCSEKKEVIEDHSIACISGYLVNMVNRTVKLITPCPPSDEYPYGYIVCDEDSFKTAKELDDFIVRTMELWMEPTIVSDKIIAFRKDLEYGDLSDGFSLKSKYKLYRFQGEAYLKELGKLISEGKLTANEVTTRLLANQTDVFRILFSTQKLYDEGIIIQI